MFTVIYQFKVQQGREEDLVQSWRALTDLIYKYEGSLGSRLHKENETTFIAYAQWPDKETWENAGSNMPEEEANKARELMKASCSEINTLHELEVVDDVLKDDFYHEKD